MVIQNNIPAFKAKKYNIIAVSGLQKTSEKLSSGFRINRAGDDASGLAVSEKLRSQLRGIKQARRNCQDGINLVQTFEGALGQSHEIIKRCKELAAEAANGTYDDPIDRAAIELEYNELCSELDAISDTDFNGICMLNGGKLQSIKQSDLYWASPMDLKWQDNTFVNQTDDPNFSMSINKLPALDELTLIDGEEKQALEEFKNSEIGVDLDNGKPIFYFKAPEPTKVIIQTNGIKGVVYIAGVSGNTPIAEVHLSGVSSTVEVEGKGNWSSSGGSITYTRPTCQSESNQGSPDSEPSRILLNADSDADSADGSVSHQDRRAEFNDWTLSLPRSNEVTFRVTDDRKHFTIVGDASYFTEDNDSKTPCDNTKVYDIGTTFIMKTTSSAANNTSRVDYVWDDAKITISWNSDRVRPGENLSLTRSPFSTGYSYPGSSRYVTEGERQRYISYNLHIGEGNVRDACYDVSSESFTGGNTNNHNFWLEHGEYSFAFVYNSAAKTWSATVDGDGVPARTFAENSTEFNAIVTKYSLSLGTAKNTIDAAVQRGYFFPGNPEDALKALVDPRYRFNTNGGDFTFRFSYRDPSVSSSSYAYWSPSSKNYDLTLGEYNPANPDAGGVDYEAATTGTYKYVNDDEINSIHAGHWEDSSGQEINLEDVGIYLPAKYDFDVLPSEEYDSAHRPLHDGMTIKISSDVTGATGKASAKVNLMINSDFTPMYDDNPANHGLTYSSTLLIQSNSRSKDIVNFTFVYHSDGVGDLECDMNCSSKGLGLKDLSIADQESSNDLIDKIDEALNKVSMVRSTFGSIHNRLEKKINNLNTADENLSEAESSIRDADMASESMKLTKFNILGQAAQSMFAQANQLPRSVLQLLG